MFYNRFSLTLAFQYLLKMTKINRTSPLYRLPRLLNSVISTTTPIPTPLSMLLRKTIQSGWYYSINVVVEITELSGRSVASSDGSQDNG